MSEVSEVREVSEVSEVKEVSEVSELTLPSRLDSLKPECELLRSA